MKPTLKFTYLTFIGLCMAALPSLAQDIDSSNLLTNTTASASSAYPAGVFDNPASFNDGTASEFVFNDSDATPEVVFNGLSSPVMTLRIYDGFAGNSVGGRASGSVSVYFSSTVASGDFATGDYTFYGTFLLPNNGDAYTGGITTSGYTYDELLNLGIPASSSGSLLLAFTPTPNTTGPGTYGPAINEIQAFAPVETPEPSVWALSLIAISAGLLFHRVRRAA